jgi:hypothetical protein
MLFLLRPRQTWGPYAGLRRDPAQQRYWNEQIQKAYGSTRRVPPAVPSPAPNPYAQLKELAELHSSGELTDAEFAMLKAKLLDGTTSPPPL